jgi:hypothetical protein
VGKFIRPVGAGRERIMFIYNYANKMLKIYGRADKHSGIDYQKSIGAGGHDVVFQFALDDYFSVLKIPLDDKGRYRVWKRKR